MIIYRLHILLNNMVTFSTHILGLLLWASKYVWFILMFTLILCGLTVRWSSGNLALPKCACYSLPWYYLEKKNRGHLIYIYYLYGIDKRPCLGALTGSWLNSMYKRIVSPVSVWFRIYSESHQHISQPQRAAVSVLTNWSWPSCQKRLVPA